ncbi:Type I Iterative PKS [Knufia fluminis]|uniref:Type I Iterative PKS n=1 Tax=Knufia fluminis TaxID=191047 RepID=A0AAN8EER5_9EURO|nr:Type I Iterative PKS [Knufia fluminis]
MASQMPIAIIGMGCRFAGEASNPEKLWKLCAESKSAWSEFPASRFNQDAFYHPNGQKLNTMNVKGGHFLSEDVALFDANFFNFTSELASVYDPQFRLQLELTYEAFENAGLSLQDVAGTNTSVFAGSFFHDYNEMHMRDPETLPRALLVSVGAAMAANRLSHFYDLRGASQTIDTGCSTTLTAFHQACQSIQAGDSDMSVISASNVILNPDNFMVMSSAFLSEAGRSYAFDSRASGYGRGEGSATVVIKRLDHALRDKDPIRAVVRATALNQDGKTETITTPSQEAQAALIRECYKKAGLNPADTTYFEAHGTGTPTGDPIEAGAVASGFSQDGARPSPLKIGSVKTNVGHTETVSGLASIIKVVMALQHKQIPPNVNFEKPNPAIPFDEYRIQIPTKLEAWARQAGIRRASVNNFGYGGANAHAILEDYASYAAFNKSESPLANHCRDLPSSPRSRVFTLSAKDEQAATRMAANLAEHLRTIVTESEQTYLDSLAYTLGQRRSKLPWVNTQSAKSISELINKLEVSQLSPRRTQEKPRIAFAFTGQGAQWWAMGRELIEAYPIFKDTINAAQSHLSDLGCTWSIIDELLKGPEDTRVNELAFSTPLSAVVQIALVELLRSWGVVPAALCSHSSGEVAAAYASGSLTLKAAMAVVFARGQIAGKTIPGVVEKRGAMIATGLGAEELERIYLSRLPKGSVVVACLNSPSSTTASGDADAVDQLENMLKTDNVFGRRLKIDCAYHSHHMEALSPTYRQWLDGLIAPDGKMDPAVIYASPTTGRREIDGSRISGPKHWVDSFASPVQFTRALHAMCFEDEDTTTSDVDVIIEIGPHAALSGPIQETVAQSNFHGCKIQYLPSLVRKMSALDTMHALACELVRAGHPLDMGSVNFPQELPDVQVLHDLPTYPWNHQKRHWSEPRMNRVHRHRTHTDHDLLGSLVLGTNMLAPTWRHILRLSDLPWLRDHVIQSDIVFPAAGYICMAIQASLQVAELNNQIALGYRFRDIEVLLALVIPDNAEGIEVQMTFTPTSSKAIYASEWTEFHVYSINSEGQWTEHCKGLVQTEIATADDAKADVSQTALSRLDNHGPMDAYRKNLAPTDVYNALHHIEVKHGPIFRNLTQVKARDTQAVATFTIADTAAAQPYKHQHAHVIHPTTLDVLFQFGYGNYIALPGANTSASFVPRVIKGLYIAHDIPNDPGHEFRAYSEIVGETSQSFDADLVVVNHTSDGVSPKPVMSVDHYITRSLGEIMQPEDTYNKLARISWQPDINVSSAASMRRALRSPTEERTARTFLNLQRLCMSYMNQAIQNISRKDVSNMEPHHKYLYYWMLLRAEMGFSDKVFACDESEAEDSSSAMETFLQDVEGTVTGRLLCDVGPKIASIMKGEIALSSIVPQQDLLSKHLSEPAGSSQCADKIATYAKLLAHKRPQLRILQVAGANESIAAKVGQALGDHATDLVDRYDITSISEEGTRAIESRLEAWQHLMTFRELDIDKNLEAQGFEAASYDLIIIDQVSDTLKSPSRALINARKLLKPEGSLVFTDPRRDLPDRWLTLGLLPEWWQQHEGNSSIQPALSTSAWSAALDDAGFTGIDHVFYDTEHKEQHSCRVIVSTVSANTPPANYAPVVLVTSGTPPPSTWLDSATSALATITGSRPSIEPLEHVQADGKLCIFLGDIERPFLRDPTPQEFTALRDLSARSKGLLWLTSGAAMNYCNIDNSLSQGFLRTLRTEYAGKRAIALDLDPKQDGWSSSSLGAIRSVFKASFDYTQHIDDFEYAVRDNVIHVPRFYKDYERNRMFVPPSAQKDTAGIQPLMQPGRRLQLAIGTPGILDTLAFVDRDDAGVALQAEQIEIRPKAFGANFRDIMSAMGQLDTNTMGFECAGTIARVGSGAAEKGFKMGDRVAALMRGDYSNAVRTSCTNVVHMPEDMSFEVAASIPKCYSAAYICLKDIAQLQKGESVLIHAACGALGQAAMMIARHVGANIFATASTSEKRDFLHKTYAIPLEQIFNSRDKSFTVGVLQATQGQGVDVVLNSLSGALLQESLNCVAQFGRFIEVGKKDFESNNSLQVGAFTRNVSFSSFDLLQYEEHKGSQVQRALKEVMALVQQQAISLVQPLNVRPLPEIEKTFRLLQSGKQIGKQVLSVNDDDLVSVLPRTPVVKLCSDASYLVVGGLGGIGRTVCEWLIGRGARNIIVMSRSATAEKIRPFADEAAQRGCRVYASACDIADKQSIQTAFDDCDKNMPPIRGVIQGAMVLQDSLVERMTHEQWNGAVRPKVHGSWNLHERLHSKEVDFFVLLSSLSGIVGLPSQCNYAAGNAYQDALAKHRLSQGLHAAAVDIGVVQAVGVVAENDKLAAGLKHWKALTEDQVLQVIGSAILSSPQDPLLLGIEGADWAASGLNRDRRFSPLKPKDSSSDHGSDGKGGGMGELAASIATASTFDEACEVVVKAIAKQLVDIFMMDERDVDATKSLVTFGVDSLSAVELRNMLALRAGAEVSIFEIMQATSVNALGSVIAARSSHIDATLVPAKD